MVNIETLASIVLQTYGLGNTLTQSWFIQAIQQTIQYGVKVFNVTQCAVGSVGMTLYDIRKMLLDIGGINGKDITTEAAITKLMYVLGRNELIFFILKSLGEIVSLVSIMSSLAIEKTMLFPEEVFRNAVINVQ